MKRRKLFKSMGSATAIWLLSPVLSATTAHSIPSRIAELWQLLTIAPRQEPAWQRYADALIAHRSALRRRRDAAIGALTDPGDRSMTSAERIESKLDPDVDVIDAKTTLRKAFDRLYAEMSPEQQHLADEYLTQGECGR
ncbi:MAG: Spy/CpxP family protein refolding chaperone [Aestuariivirga sp.]